MDSLDAVMGRRPVDMIEANGLAGGRGRKKKHAHTHTHTNTQSYSEVGRNKSVNTTFTGGACTPKHITCFMLVVPLPVRNHRNVGRH